MIGHKLNDIKTVYHPRTGKAPLIQSLEEYNTADSQARVPSQSTEAPWRPYETRLDFEFSEFAMTAYLNKEHVEKLILLLNIAASRQDKLTITSNAELVKLRESASSLLTPYKETELEIPYEEETRKYSVWGRDLWDWAMDNLLDTRLTPHWNFDSIRLFKWDGIKWVRFRHEPWTADMMWNVQSSLPDGGTPFGFIIYADKTKLSSFGTEKGYPVLSRCAHLPIEIRNGVGIGGGALVGWLPLVEEGTAEEGRKNYVDFKRVVWHAAFYELCRKVEPMSHVGVQCTMTLIRGGHQSIYNCTVCLVHSDDLSKLEEHALLRTQEATMTVLAMAESRNKTQGEALLKQYGLRKLANVFFRINNSDPFKAVSWDRLHAYGIGLFGDHIWEEITNLIKEDHDDFREVDKQANEFPRWRGLTHFKQVVGINFNDGSKFEDLSKITPYITHHVIATEKGSQGYLLLCLLHKFLELDMLYSFRIQTDDTIALIRAKLVEFSHALEVTKNWNFPKIHSHQHGPEDIEAKGITANFNTKPYEKMHGAFKKTYLRCTNKRNVAPQILTREHDKAVIDIIRANIKALPRARPRRIDEKPLKIGDHLVLGSPQKSTSIEQLAASNPICKDLHVLLNNYFEEVQVRTSKGQKVNVTPKDQIVEYRFLKVNYQSQETWKQATDYLRCNPLFYGQPRFDHVMLGVEDGEIFSKLLFVFSILLEGVCHPIIMVRPLDGEVMAQEKDRDLGFYRTCPGVQPRELFSASDIIRGALIVADTEKDGEFLVVDTDPDIFCRLNVLRHSRFDM
ncbi:hypothetical protein FOMPIDRAFT_1131204 [Fomitopsis schrenkii]|uniref:Uncharacterized protein n=1 Tax=Fomitopsis schrenkii TaxID=2126942 RepID=S8DS04_FOMSC|nr:hypothetical protein FOMPIDRAFT_1131204 [Fomitopsis schrenkii]